MKEEYVFPSDEASKAKIKGAITEMVSSLARAQAEKDFQKEVTDDLKESVGIPPSILKKLARIKFKEDREEIESQMDDLLSVYDTLFENRDDILDGD
jgi:hypothetical protein